MAFTVALLLAAGTARGEMPRADRDGPTVLDPLVIHGERAPQPRLRRAPPYPMSARNRWEEGCVVLRFVVRPDGKTDDFTILESHPLGVFEKSVIGTVYDWQYDRADRPREVTEVFEFRNPDLAAQPRYSVTRAHKEYVGLDGSGKARYRFEMTLQGYRPPSCRVPR
ncbi:MAG TPA: energy transducer TonB [Candidatus Binatia bacterium]|nr:energy transducer TonB [Candidatus Binatia bacterium]